MFQSKRQSGFSILELMVTVMLMGIIIGMVAPNFSRYNRNRQFEASAKRIVGEMRQMRMIAIGQHHRVRIDFDVDGYSYVVSIDADDSGTFEPTEVDHAFDLVNDYPSAAFHRLSSINGSIDLPVTTQSGGVTDAIAFGPDGGANDWTGFNFTGGALRDGGSVSAQTGCMFLSMRHEIGDANSTDQIAITIYATGTVKAWRYIGNNTWVDIL